LLRVQLVSHFDVFVVSPGDLEREVCGCELNEAEPEVTGVAIVIVGLDVANVVVIVLKLALNKKIRLGGRRYIKIIVVVAGSLAIERDLRWAASMRTIAPKPAVSRVEISQRSKPLTRSSTIRYAEDPCLAATCNPVS
jgi:hypothetical protein